MADACTECGMPCEQGEYHPFAACLMFKACHSGEVVRANLAFVRGAAPQPQAAQPVPAQVVRESTDFSEFEKAALLLAGMVQEYHEFAGGGLFFDKAKAVFDAIAATPPTQAAADVRDGPTDTQMLDWLSRAGAVSFEAVIDAPHDGDVALCTDIADTAYGPTLREAIRAAIDTELNRATPSASASSDPAAF